MLTDLEGNGLILHHWDTDGICSAAMLLDFLSPPLDTRVPRLGNYYLSEKEIQAIKNYDYVCIVDLALPAANFLRIEANRVVLIDHHHQKKIAGINSYRDEGCVSTSWAISRLFGSWDLLSILGAVGDKSVSIKEDKEAWKRTEEMLDKYALTFPELLQIVKLIDSNYKLNDKKGVEEAVTVVWKNKKKPRNLLRNPKWNKQLKRLRAEMKMLKKGKEKGKVWEDGDLVAQKINTKYNLISALARHLVWELQYNTAVVINTGFFQTQEQVYVRSKHRDLTPVIELGKRKGYCIGGKSDVVGAIVPKERCKLFVDEILAVLR